MIDIAVNCIPVNRVALRGVLEGIPFEERRQESRWTSDIPIPTEEFPIKDIEKELIGKKVGKLTVIGYAGSHMTKYRARWLVRCVCSLYELRGTKALRNPKNKYDCCFECQELKIFRRRNYFQQHGRNATEDEIGL